jgi:hypothetical protein
VVGRTGRGGGLQAFMVEGCRMNHKIGATEDAFQCFDNLPGVARQTTSVRAPAPDLVGLANQRQRRHSRIFIIVRSRNANTRHLHMSSFKPSHHARRESSGTLDLCPSHLGMRLRPRAIVCVRSMPRHRPGCTACCQLR